MTSEKGKPKLFHGGHLYYKDYSACNAQGQESTYWKCEHFRNKCPARVTTSGSTIVRSRGDHNHAGDAAHVEAAKTMENIRIAAKDSRDAPSYIVSAETIGLSQATSAKLPSVQSMKRTVTNVRRKENAGPAVPRSLRDIVLPVEYKQTFAGATFLAYDSGPADDRILIFATERNLQLLGRSKHWYADGTFKTVPSLFEQLYTIHGLKENTSVPLVYALLGDKKKETYIHLLQKIKELLPAVAGPETIMTDFEMAMVSAVSSEFPLSTHRGCFFHLCQCIWRKTQSSGLKEQYETNAEFALRLRMLSSLAFVPVDEVTRAFDILIDGNVLPDEAQPLIDYFEDTWIGRPDRRQRRRHPMFALQMWNCYDGVLSGLPKTNNSIEGWHRGFMYQVSANHPDIWKFISAIKREQNLNEVRIEQYVSGQARPPPKKKYKDSAERLTSIVQTWRQDFQDDEICDYLRGIAHNISY